MIIYTVFDAREGVEMAFPTKREAVEFAKNQTEGSTTVHREDIGAPTRDRVCRVYNRQGYCRQSTEIIIRRFQ